MKEKGIRGKVRLSGTSAIGKGRHFAWSSGVYDLKSVRVWGKERGERGGAGCSFKAALPPTHNQSEWGLKPGETKREP